MRGVRLLILTMTLVLASLATDTGGWPRRDCRLAARARGSQRAFFQAFAVAPATIRVHDGDTFYVGDETIRLRTIDTPELGEPRSTLATWRLRHLLSAGTVTIVPRFQDIYCRTVADVYVGGANVADVLRREGYAKPRPFPRR